MTRETTDDGWYYLGTFAYDREQARFGINGIVEFPIPQGIQKQLYPFHHYGSYDCTLMRLSTQPLNHERQLITRMTTHIFVCIVFEYMVKCYWRSKANKLTADTVKNSFEFLKTIEVDRGDLKTLKKGYTKHRLRGENNVNGECT
jgi:hypothetical protein